MHGPSPPTGCGAYLENVHGLGAVDTGLRLLPLTGAQLASAKSATMVGAGPTKCIVMSRTADYDRIGRYVL